MSQLRFLLLFVGMPLVLVWGSWLGLSRLLGGEVVLPPKSCDSLLVQLNADLSNELDRALAGGETRCGTTGGASEVVACALALHRDDVNPEDPTRRAFVGAQAAEGLIPCQVEVAAVERNAVRISQRAAAGAEPRSFRIVID